MRIGWGKMGRGIETGGGDEKGKEPQREGRTRGDRIELGIKDKVGG